MEISFKAKLKLEDNFFQKMPNKINKDELKKVILNYQTYLEQSEACRKLIPQDEVKLSFDCLEGRYNINLDIFDKANKEPYQTTIGISRKQKPQFNLASFIFQTKLYIVQKYGIEKRFSQGIFDYVNHGFEKLLRG